MTEVTIPSFGELLSPQLSRIPDPARPGCLARLERSAAERYRGWAAELPEHREGLLKCADREDEIADRIEAILPVPSEFEDLVSYGAIGLLEAVERFDPERDNQFSTFVDYRIRGAMWDGIRSLDEMSRYSRDQAKSIKVKSRPYECCKFYKTACSSV